MNKINQYILALILCVFSVFAQAAEFENTQYEGLITDELAFFELTQEDALRYQEIMRTTPAGSWYEHLDPVEVLGIMAKTDEERAKYARLTAKGAYERLDRELKFMHAYKDAYKELYPGVRAIQRTSNRDGYFLGPSDTLAYFTALNDDRASEQLDKLKAFSLKYNSHITVYFLDEPRPSKQIGFLMKSGVTHDDIKSKRVVIAQDDVPEAIWLQSNPVGALGIRYQNGEIQWISGELQ